MAIYPDTLDPAKLSDLGGSELWRRTIKVGGGSVIVLGGLPHGGGPRRRPSTGGQRDRDQPLLPPQPAVSSVVIWNEYGEDALKGLKDLEKTVQLSA